MPTQKITGQTQLNPPIPVTTAINDFQVGDGAGNWTTNTLGQVATTLQANPPSGTQAHVALVGQASGTSATPLMTPPADGLFQLSYYVETIVTGAVGTLALAFGWTDENGVQAITPVSSLLLTTTGYASGEIIVHAKTTGTINYTVTLTGVVGSPQYNLYIFLERLF